MRPDTQLVQGPPHEVNGSLHSPIYLNVSFKADSPETLAARFQHLEPGHVYSRLQTPNSEALEQKLTALLRAKGTVATNTGMSAITGVLLTLAHAGAQIIAAPNLFSGTLNLLRKVMPKFGVQVDFCDLNDVDAVASRIRQNTCMVFGEPLGNPSLKLMDVPALANLCQHHRVPLVLDCTMTPPCMFDPGRWPVAVGIHSSTKYIMGNGSLLGGLVCDWGHFPWSEAKDPLLRQAASEHGEHAFLEHFRTLALHTAGFTQQPFAAAMHEVQLETLSIRHQRQCENAQRLAEFFNWQASVQEVAYLGLETDPGHELAQRLFTPHCFGNLLTLELGTQERAFAFLNQLKIVNQMTNLGDLRSLIIHPASTMYHACSEEERQCAGVTPGLIRLSVGVENVDDLLEDFAAAVAAVQHASV